MRELIKLWDKVRWPAPEMLFEAHCKNEIGIAIELCVLRKQKGEWQVLLIYRQDKFFKGWHMPGSLLMPGETIVQVFKRLSHDEIGVAITKPKFVTINEHFTRRGYEISLVHTCHLVGKGIPQGKFFSLDKPPSTTLSTHKEMIRAVRRTLV